MAERRPIGARRTAATKPKNNYYYGTEEGIRNTDKELEKQKQRREAAEKGFGPLRFFVPAGETKEAIIVDDKPSFFMYEHTSKNPATGKFDVHTGCVKAWDHCPGCESWGESTWVMFLTVIDLTPFKDRNGVTHEFSRKLVPVKPSQQKKFTRKYEKEGTLRGALYSFSRDSKNSAAIGNDIEFIEYVDEDELATYTRTWKDKDNKRHEEDCSEPFDYPEIFEEPTVEKLLALTGGEPVPGSRSQRKRDLGSDDDGWEKDKDDDAPWDDDSSARGRTTTSSRRGRAAPADDGDDDTATRRASRPQPPSRRGARAAVKDEDKDDDAPPVRVARRPVRR